ncbi:MAG: outer membrane protein assembly factor BamE [Planctomycetes bacterium]|nr:outer membrane protein assembly factor BamE [Planctomycetota bacterium]MBL7008636.1 outer membrane protein assembly factor BamE [Planctomycetota bacterium]
MTRSLVAPRRILASALLAAGALTAPACVISAGSDSEVSGQYVSQTTLDRIQPGKDQAYVLALIGEPSSKSKLDDGTEIWKWRYVEKKRTRGHLIFIFDTDSKTETRHLSYVEFGPDGMVVKSWQD